MNEQHDAILDERAAVLAKHLQRQTIQLRGNELVLVELSGLRVGIPIGSLRVIVTVNKVTPLPGVPNWMLGLIQLQGALLCVIDFALLWGQPGGATGRDHVAIVEGTCGSLGLIVDTVVGVRRIEDSEISPELSQEEGNIHPYVRFVTSDLIRVLDIDILTQQHALIVSAPTGTPSGAAHER